MDQTIQNWSPMELQRFIRGLLGNDSSLVSRTLPDYLKQDEAGQTGVLQLKNLGAWQLAFIPQQNVAFPANDVSGNSAANVPLGLTWSQHIAFIPTFFWPLGHWNWSMKVNGYVIDGSNGSVLVNNAGGAQTFQVSAFSIGIP